MLPLLRIVLLMPLMLAQYVMAEAPEVLLERFDNFPHVERISRGNESVIDYEIGLGALRKVRGVWGFKDSERLSGELTRYTWQLKDGFSANEVLAELEAQLDPALLLFQCDGRSCGKGVQWANRVFRERLLYGRDDQQRYRVYGEGGEEGGYRLLLFSSARTADRQYLHVELLRVAA